MAEQFLNHTLVYTEDPTGKKQHFRVCEIEFYLNSTDHPDTFTHGDPMQKLNAQWYFHKMNGSYKAGTYKGLDLSFGRPEIGAVGGILIRAIMPCEVNTEGGELVGKPLTGELIEGPCNSVNRILESTLGNKDQGIKDLVQMKSFSLDAFASSSNFHLVKASLPTRQLWQSPRVGLSLKKMDAEKPKYWLADYRFLAYPELHHKMKDTIILGMIRAKESVSQITQLAKCKTDKVEQMRAAYLEGLKSD